MYRPASTIRACTGLYFDQMNGIDYYFEYLDVEDTSIDYTWVIDWGGNYSDETITVNFVDVPSMPDAPDTLATLRFGMLRVEYSVSI